MEGARNRYMAYSWRRVAKTCRKKEAKMVSPPAWAQRSGGYRGYPHSIQFHFPSLPFLFLSFSFAFPRASQTHPSTSSTAFRPDVNLVAGAHAADPY